MAKLDVPLPASFVEAIQHLVDARNAEGGPGHKRVYARDLHEAAIAELVGRAEEGDQILFLAPPSGKGRKTLWVDDKLKAGVDRLATEHGVTRAAVVMTAFHHYLNRLGLLDRILTT